MLKSVFLSLLLSLSLSLCLAQDTPNELANRHNFIFQHLNRSEATTGILLDYGIEFQNMDNYDGSVLLDSNNVSITDWRTIYATLLTSQYNYQVTFPSPSSLNTTINSYVADNLAMPFVLLHYNYNTLRSDAISAGLFTASGDQLYDVPGRSQSPYLQKTVFAIAPAENNVDAVNGYKDFIFRNDLIFGNTGKVISLIKVDFGDGNGLQTISLNTAKGVTYTNGGAKNLIYEVTYTDNTTFTGHSSLYINYIVDTSDPGDNLRTTLHAKIPDRRISASTMSGTRYATLEIALSAQNTTNTIKKPLIIVEGIDFWRILTPNQPLRNVTLKNYLGTGGMLNTALFPTGKLDEKLDLEGYDIVFVDFDEATDRLENNTELVKSAINYVNGNKTGNEQNVVMGVSMGAVLARNALRQMELSNVSHDTRLYISVDGPHQGANIPLGLQAMVVHLANSDITLPLLGGANVLRISELVPDLDRVEKVLRSGAAEQLLKYSYSNNGSILSAVHNNFFSTYQSQGYPVNCRNVAVSNGSECGTTQPFAPNQSILYINESFRISYVFDAATSWLQAFAIFTNRPLVGLYAPLSLLSTRTSFEIQFDVRTLPNQNSDRIYYGRIGIKRKILGLFNVNANLINRSLYSNPSILPYDGAPGGSMAIKNSGLGMPATLEEYFSIPSFCFIPTVSALDIGGSAGAINYSRLNSGYSRDTPPASPYASPFANFVTTVNRNESHVTFTPRNGDFILKELAGTTTGFASCGQFCNPSALNITGPNLSGGNTTYSVTGVPSGAIINWQVSSPYSIAGASNATTVGIVIPSSNNRFAELVANVSTPCMDFVVRRTLVPPTITTTLEDNNGICGSGTASVNMPPGINFVWSATGDISIEGLAKGQSYATTSNTINIVGIEGTIRVSFQSYGNTVTTNKVYAPYNCSVHVSANPMIGSDPLSVSLQGVAFNYNSISWYLDGEFLNNNGESFFDSDNPKCGSHSLVAMAELSCGLTVRVGATEVERICGGSWSIVMYPNPVSDELKVEYIEDAAKQRKASGADVSQPSSDPGPSFEAKIFNEKGKLMRAVKNSEHQKGLVLGTADFPNGTYFLHVQKGKEVIKKQIIVRH